jgi:hypothetical protein
MTVLARIHFTVTATLLQIGSLAIGLGGQTWQRRCEVAN